MKKKDGYEDEIEFNKNIEKKKSEEYLIWDGLSQLYPRCAYRKFLGSATAEVIRQHLRKHGFNISQINRYIDDVKSELDLLLLKKSVKSNKLLYKPEEVLAVLEIKFRGSFGKPSLYALNWVNKAVKKIKKNIACIYITLIEGEKYKNKITKSSTGFEVFELFYYKGDIMHGKKKQTHKWDKLLKFLKKIKAK